MITNESRVSLVFLVGIIALVARPTHHALVNLEGIHRDQLNLDKSVSKMMTLVDLLMSERAVGREKNHAIEKRTAPLTRREVKIVMTNIDEIMNIISVAKSRVPH